MVNNGALHVPKKGLLLGNKNDPAKGFSLKDKCV